MQRVSKTQKRVRATSKGAPKEKQRESTGKKKLRAKALHLWLGAEHFHDRAAAEKLRQFPNVPRRKQSPFPRDVEVGFAGHFKNGKFEIQGREEFVPEFERNAENAWYLRTDKRGNRKPRREDSGMFETNAALSTGLSMVLADLVRDGRLNYVRTTVQLASEAGMSALCDHTGYLPGYLSIHPDAEGTLSTHHGAWTVDPNQRKLVGISATGKRGRKGPKNLGSCFISILRHNRAIGLPDELTRMPKHKLEERVLLDWAISCEMDKIVTEEFSKLPNGQELLKRAEQYQREVAEDWLRRYRASKAGVDKQPAELESAHKKIEELQEIVNGLIKKNQPKKKQLSLRRRISGVLKLADFFGNLCKGIGRFFVNVNRSIPAIEITYSVPSWMTKKTKSIDTPNPQQRSVEFPQEARALSIALETVHQPLVMQSVGDHSSIKTETDRPSKPQQDSQARSVKKTSVEQSRPSIDKDDQQMSM